ncbi:MAG: L,D-transpeptidase family protein [Chloroflexi bacterium]|nr:L,D-transpeptidase family protein [Chloroflexota bacterium]MCL5273261.1 L,D-transpeptidase family protein [Chloroflexota bacterium]
MQQTTLSRRRVLRLAGGILAAAPFVHAMAPALAEETDPVIVPSRRPFGRVIQGGLAVRERPSVKAKRLRVLKLNEVIAIKGQTTSDESPTAYNKTWYQTDDGYTYSAFVQPSENTLNTPLDSVDKKGFWGEITVPLTESRSAPASKSYLRYRYYYGCVFKVIASVVDASRVVWYQISDEYAGNAFYVKAEHIRPIPPSEFTPISPDVPMEEKRMEVNLKQQVATAFEGDKPVFSARVATGASFRMADGTVQNFGTTPGAHRIFLKLPSQHMVGGAAGDSDYYDLPGIGWVSYFTTSGIAFHGTYWHNDYGKPRSHGCVNMLPEDAKWVFLWTLPTAAYEERRVRTTRRTDGSLVKVY